MAKTFDNARLQIRYDCGLNDQGRTIVRNKSYGDVRQNVTDVKLRAVIDAINGLVNTSDSELETKLITSEFVNA